MTISDFGHSRQPSPHRFGIDFATSVTASWLFMLSIIFALTLAPTSAAAQGVFPCTWGPGHVQVGQTMQGTVTVPLCVQRPAEPAARRDSGSRVSDGDSGYDPLGGVYIPGPLPEPPRGWRPLYGAFIGFVSSQDEYGDNKVHDYILTLNHATRTEAEDAAIALCMERAVFPDPTGACYPFVIDRPYVVVVHHAAEDGRYSMTQSTTWQGTPENWVRRPSGEMDICSFVHAPEFTRPCNRLERFERNGLWPE